VRGIAGGGSVVNSDRTLLTGRRELVRTDPAAIEEKFPCRSLAEAMISGLCARVCAGIISLRVLRHPDYSRYCKLRNPDARCSPSRRHSPSFSPPVNRFDGFELIPINAN